MKEELRRNYRGVFDGELGFGQSPALLIVDFIRSYVTPNHPLYAPDVVEAVKHTEGLLRVARSKEVPIIYTKVEYHPSLKDGGLFTQKIPILRSLVPGEPMGEIVTSVRPEPCDLVIAKQYASAFFGTPLASTLSAMGIDTLIVAGCSTSGCIRATAVDGMQHGLRVVVPRECVGDRAIEPHEANLFDIHSKYGDVLLKQDVVDYLEDLRR